MNVTSIALSLFMSFILIACQAKEGASGGGGLISDHKPAKNSFTLVTPANKTYKASEKITLEVAFPIDLILDVAGGEPRLKLTIGSTTRYAQYEEQADPRKIRFTYTVVNGDNDTDGITVVALETNGSAITFLNKEVQETAKVDTLKSKTLSGVKIDTAAPTIKNFRLNSLGGLYNAGDKIEFAFEFSEKVIHTGSSKFTVDLATGGTIDVNYARGSGTKTLVYSFTVAPSYSDTNGFDDISDNLVLTGSITDSVGNDANLDYSSFVANAITSTAAIRINGELPYVVDFRTPANGVYSAGQMLDFDVTFDRDVNVTGTHIEITIGSTVRKAIYLDGSGTNVITYRYSIVPGDIDTNGITVASKITQDTGNIVDSDATSISYFSDVDNNSYVVPSTAGIKLNALQPQPISVSRNQDISPATWGTAVDNVWIIGQELLITVGFNTKMFVTQTNGTPSIPMTIGSTVKHATYWAGHGQTSLIFRYIIQEGDLDTDTNIALGAIELNGGVISDEANTNTLLTLPVAALSTTSIDGVKPTILTVAAPANGTYSQVAPQNAAALDFTVTWNEPVNLSNTAAGGAYISMTIGATNVLAQYASGNQTATIIHTPTSLAGRNDTDGITIASTIAGTAVIKDRAGNTATTLTFTPPDTSQILVDTTAPTVTSVVALNANGTYSTGDNLDFQVTFSEPVTTKKNANFPRINITIGSTTYYLLPVTESTNTVHTFRYTIAAGLVDTNGVTLGNNVTSSGTTAYARDGGRNNVSGSFTPPNTTGILVDSQAPTVLSSSSTTPGTYVSSDTLSVSVTYSEAVDVDTTGGTPYIAVDFDQGTDNYVYASGSGTATLVFSRTLGASHFDMTGLPSVSSINLNGGTITDSGGNNAPTTFPVVDLSTTYVTYPEVRLWVKSNFVNLAPTGGVTITKTGDDATEVCGLSNCRRFNDGDSLTLTSPLNSVSAVLMAIKMPAGFVSGTEQFDIFDTDMTLVEDQDNNGFDFRTANSSLFVNGYGVSNGVNHDFNIPVSMTKVIQTEFTASQSYSGVLIDNTFTGAIGEIIAIDGNLNSTQIDNLRNYLNTRFVGP